MPLYALAATVKQSTPTGFQMSQAQGYRLSRNEDEARGSFVAAVMERCPDWEIALLSCLELSPDMVRAAAAEIA